MSQTPFNEAQYKNLSQDILDYAKKRGADGVELSLGVAKGFSVEVRKQEVEKVEFDNGKSLDITVYKGKKRGSASTSDFNMSEVKKAVDAAISFSKYAADDPHMSLPDKSELAFDYPDCDLYHPWNISVEQGTDIAMQCEAQALAIDERIVNSEGAAISTHSAYDLFANSLGFVGGNFSSSHDLSCALIAKQDGVMERDGEYTSNYCANELWSAEKVAKLAAENTLARLGSRKIKTQKTPVIFKAPSSNTIISCLLSAISGSNIYHKTTFLLDQLGKIIVPEFITLQEQPHIKRATGAEPFDGEGVRTRDNIFVKNGELQSYILGTYSANQLGLKTTGNAGGVNNLIVSCQDKSFDELVKQMDNGLIVTDMMGQGINVVTGDFSQGASGFWVENGEIQYPVSEITIAGNLKQMLSTIVAISNDVDHRRNVKVGSILIDEMMVAGD